MDKFDSFIKSLNSVSSFCSNLLSELNPADLSPEELAYINANDAEFFKKQIEVVGLGTYVDPNRLIHSDAKALDILAYDDLKGLKVMPKHYMINDVKSKGNNVEVSWELPSDFKNGYYISPALVSVPRSNSRQRFEKNVIVFENEEIVYFEFSPSSDAFEISIREALQPGKTILDIDCRMYDFSIPKNESDIDALSASTGLRKEYYQLFWNLRYKSYGRRKFPKFSLNLQQLDLGSLYNLYK